MNPYVTYLHELMVEHRWDRPELVRRSGLTRAHVHQILRDKRESFNRAPEPETVSALSKAFGVPESRFWIKIAQSMGLPVGEIEVANAEHLSDGELVREITRRLSRRPQLVVVPEAHDHEVYDADAALTTGQSAGPSEDAQHIDDGPQDD